MGLDMYLKAEKYVSGWQHNPDEEINEYERLISMFGMEDFVSESSPSSFVQFTVGYWRKANQIHAWFVRECQGGRDECQPTDVGIEKLVELQKACEFALGVREKVGVNVGAARRTAIEVLPPTSGFFFGGEDVDEWYWQALESTVTIVNKCIALDKAPGYWSFIYQSSW